MQLKMMVEQLKSRYNTPELAIKSVANQFKGVSLSDLGPETRPSAEERAQKMAYDMDVAKRAVNTDRQDKERARLKAEAEA